MVESLIRGIIKWPKHDLRDLVLAIVKRLDVSDLAEVLAAAHQRIHREAERRKESKRVAGGSEKRKESRHA